jgi:D-tyrosyl-tRNA(Tyr) deacylase
VRRDRYSTSDGDEGPHGPDTSRYVVVVSELDPVARAVAERWGTPPATGDHVDGQPLRRLGEHAFLLKRPGLHIRDDWLDRRLPGAMREPAATLVFPSIHRGEQNVRCFTVHPLGNPGPVAEVGGRPRTFVPTDPRRMVDALRRLDEVAGGVGWSTTYEATHHGPELGLPSFFVEIGCGTDDRPPADAAERLAEVVPELEPDPRDRVALAVGGGHYAPHFTDLAVKRRWSFGHILSKHAVVALDPATARAAWEATPSAEGIVYARAQDAMMPVWNGLGDRLRDGDAPTRERAATSASRSASGT